MLGLRNERNNTDGHKHGTRVIDLVIHYRRDLKGGSYNYIDNPYLVLDE